MREANEQWLTYSSHSRVRQVPALNVHPNVAFECLKHRCQARSSTDEPPASYKLTLARRTSLAHPDVRGADFTGVRISPGCGFHRQCVVSPLSFGSLADASSCLSQTYIFRARTVHSRHRRRTLTCNSRHHTVWKGQKCVRDGCIDEGREI